MVNVFHRACGPLGITGMTFVQKGLVRGVFVPVHSVGESGQECGLGPARACPAGLRLWSFLWPGPGSFSKTVALGRQDKLILSQSLISSPSRPPEQGLNEVGGVNQVGQGRAGEALVRAMGL